MTERKHNKPHILKQYALSNLDNFCAAQTPGRKEHKPTLTSLFPAIGTVQSCA